VSFGGAPAKGNLLGRGTISPDNSRVAMVRADRKATYVIDLKSKSLTAVLKSRGDLINDVIFLPDGKQVIGVGDYYPRWILP